MENGGNLEARVHNLEARFARVEQILPTLATKDDLKGFATKDDLKGMPTIDDPKGFATKADLEHEIRLLREFVGETFGHLRKDLAEDHRRLRAEMKADRRAMWRSTLALIEAEREQWAVVMDDVRRTSANVGSVDVAARQRDLALERRIDRLEER